MITRQQIIDLARSFVGTRYHHQGRLPGVGLDCIGVVACAGRICGVEHDFQGYSHRPDCVTLQREFDRVLIPIRNPEVQPGDVITFWMEKQGCTQHAAIATDLGIIHATIHFRRVVEHGMDSYFQSRVMQCYRFPNVDPEPYPTKFKWMLYDPQTIQAVERQSRAMGRTCCGG